MSRAQLALALSKLPQIEDERILVGTNTADDAGVIQISDDLALVHTVDVFAPVVNDPYTFGRIAAVNSLSDIYAMGAIPLAALNVVGFPTGMDIEILSQILHGGQDAVVEAGAAMLGGHTFQDSEIRFGLAVTGQIHPKNICTNSGAKPDDYLVLTKPLGTGTIIQAMANRGIVSDSVYNAAVKSMSTSNFKASIAMKNICNACTDITGFGFIGHCWEMAEASKVSIDIFSSKLPVLPKVFDLINDGVVDAGVKQNKNSFEKIVKFDKSVNPSYETLLFSSETSGGLLIAISENFLNELSSRLNKSACEWRVVGRVKDNKTGFIYILP